jgi:4-hydroxybenzoyl-CoA thioesterase/acyl-CoA thioester hydrolase
MVAPYVSQRRVEFRDTDAAGIMHFSAFFTCMEEVEHEFLRSLGKSVVMPLPASDVEPAVGTMSWPRVAAQCEYSGGVRFEDMLTIELRVTRIGRSSVTYEFRFLAHQQSIAIGSVTAVCCRILPGQPPQPMPIPDDLRHLLTGHLADERA